LLRVFHGLTALADQAGAAVSPITSSGTTST
jgi:hypothetical protein